LKFDFYKKWFNILNFSHYVDFIYNKNKKHHKNLYYFLLMKLYAFFCFFCVPVLCVKWKKELYLFVFLHGCGCKGCYYVVEWDCYLRIDIPLRVVCLLNISGALLRSHQ
ncbi:TPA: hypothetical protein ACIX8U_005366, partial [Escherichia coli]